MLSMRLSIRFSPPCPLVLKCYLLCPLSRPFCATIGGKCLPTWQCVVLYAAGLAIAFDVECIVVVLQGLVVVELAEFGSMMSPVYISGGLCTSCWPTSCGVLASR
eukprot:6490529-Amphidinium_carterae.1